MRHRLIVVVLLIGPAYTRSADLSENIPALVQKLGDQDSAVRLKAIRDLGNMGRAARSAAPALARAMRDPAGDVGRRAALTLAQLGELVLLIDAVGDPNDRVRSDAMRALAWFGPDAAPAVPALTAALRGEAEATRSVAVHALGEVGPGAADAAPALARLWRTSPPAGRRAVTQALQKIGPAAVLPLLRLAREGAAGDQADALAALALLGDGAQSAVPALREWLRHDNAAMRAGAAKILGLVGEGAREAAPDLVRTLQDADQTVQRQAGRALLNLAACGVPGLVAPVLAADPGRKWAEPLVRARFGEAAAEDVVGQLKRLRADDPKERTQAVQGLARFTSEAQPVVAGLALALQDRDAQVRMAAAVALAKLQRNNLQTVAALQNILDEASLASSPAFWPPRSPPSFPYCSPSRVAYILDRARANDFIPGTYTTYQEQYDRYYSALTAHQIIQLRAQEQFAQLNAIETLLTHQLVLVGTLGQLRRDMPDNDVRVLRTKLRDPDAAVRLMAVVA